MFIKEYYIRELFEALNSAKNLRYVLIKNINLELPSHLKNGKDIDILVHEKDKELAEKTMIYAGFVRIRGESGWDFGYQLQESQLWRKIDIDQEFYVDTCFKLSCKSISKKMWIPLDESINKNIWINKRYDELLNCWRIDPITELCYLIIRSVFDKKKFMQNYIDEIEKSKHLLSDVMAIDILEKVFFKYSGRLIELIISSKFSDIIDDYISFDNY